MSAIPPIPGTSYAPVGYATPMLEQRRPGIMTAVGVISIVVGSLGALASVYGVIMGMVYLTMSQITFPVPTVTPTTMTTTVTAGTGGTPPAPPSWSATTVSGTTVSTTTGTAAAGTIGMSPFSLKVDLGASILTMVEGALSLGAGVLLIFAGSLLLRNSARARGLHRIYIVVKFPLIVMGAIATWWISSSMFNNMNNMMATSGAPISLGGMGSLMGLAQAFFYAIFSLIYPVALIIVFMTGTAKRYFAEIGA